MLDVNKMFLGYQRWQIGSQIQRVPTGIGQDHIRVPVGLKKKPKPKGFLSRPRRVLMGSWRGRAGRQFQGIPIGRG